MFDEHVTSHVNRKWGKDSTEAAALSALLSDVYDTSRSYRILTSLRNAMVHSSRSLVVIGVNAKLVNPSAPGKDSIASVSIHLDRERFAATDTNAKVRAEVLGLAVAPDLIAESEEAIQAVEAKEHEITRFLYPELEPAVKTLWPYFIECHRLGRSGPHFHTHEAGKPFGSLSMIPMSKELFAVVVAEATALGLDHDALD
jgi:hypothetical protein